MSRRLPGWARSVIERDSDVRVPLSCSALVRPLELPEVREYEQAGRGSALVQGPGWAWRRELGDTMTASIAGEVRDG